jgi:hypothetical protein
MVDNAENGIAPDAIAHCVNCGSNRIEADDDGESAYCLHCHTHETTVEWIAGADMPDELAKIWASAPVIPPAYIIETKVYQFGEIETPAYLADMQAMSDRFAAAVDAFAQNTNQEAA